MEFTKSKIVIGVIMFSSSLQLFDYELYCCLKVDKNKPFCRFFRRKSVCNYENRD